MPPYPEDPTSEVPPALCSHANASTESLQKLRLKRDDIIGTLNVAIRRGALVLLGGLDGVSADREVAPRHEQVGQPHHVLHLGMPRSLAVTLKSTHCQCHMTLEPA